MQKENRGCCARPLGVPASFCRLKGSTTGVEAGLFKHYRYERKQTPGIFRILMEISGRRRSIPAAPTINQRLPIQLEIAQGDRSSNYATRCSGKRPRQCLGFAPVSCAQLRSFEIAGGRGGPSTSIIRKAGVWERKQTGLCTHTWNLFERTVNVADDRNAKDDVNPPENCTLRAAVH